MSLPNTGMDETSPSGSQAISLGDDRIREYKIQNREVLEVDHDYPSSGKSATAGQHKKVSLIEQADLGTGATGLPLLGGQTVSGKPELVYTDEDNNDIQLTKGGGQNYGAPAALANMAGIMNFIYPVGIVITLGVSTNPATLLGIGTWTQIKGKVIVGKADSGTFQNLDATGGEETHVLTAAEMPAHTHSISSMSVGLRDGTTANGTWVASGGPTATSSAGSDGAHNNLQPYIVKYVWQRTA